MPSRQMSFREIRKSVKMIFLSYQESRDDQRKDEEEMLWKVDGIEYVLDKVEHLVKTQRKFAHSSLA